MVPLVMHKLNMGGGGDFDEEDSDTEEEMNKEEEQEEVIGKMETATSLPVSNGVEATA